MMRGLMCPNWEFSERRAEAEPDPQAMEGGAGGPRRVSPRNVYRASYNVALYFSDRRARVVGARQRARVRLPHPLTAVRPRHLTRGVVRQAMRDSPSVGLQGR